MASTWPLKPQPTESASSATMSMKRVSFRSFLLYLALVRPSSSEMGRIASATGSSRSAEKRFLRTWTDASSICPSASVMYIRIDGDYTGG